MRHANPTQQKTGELFPRLAGPNTVLLLLLGLALVRGLLYAVLNPPFGSPDERDHFQYVAYLAGASAEGGTEAHQPAPYYFLMVPAYLLAAGQTPEVQLLAIRLASIPFLLGTVLFAWLAAGRMAPGRPVVAAAATAFVALHPQLAYIGASANNDNAANFMAAVLTYLLVALLTAPSRWTAGAMAIALGLAILTKGQILPMLVIYFLALAGYVGSRLISAGTWRTAAYALVALGAGAVALATPGGKVIIIRGLSALSILGDWPKLLSMAAKDGPPTFAYQYTSFWAGFLGESVHPPFYLFAAPGAVLAFAVAGYALRARRPAVMSGGTLVALRAALALTIPAQWLTVYVQHLELTADFPTYAWLQQTVQGRYMLIFVVPLALLIAEGWDLLVSRRSIAAPALGIIGLLALFDLSAVLSLAGYYGWPSTG